MAREERISGFFPIFLILSGILLPFGIAVGVLFLFVRGFRGREGKVGEEVVGASVCVYVCA